MRRLLGWSITVEDVDSAPAPNRSILQATKGTPCQFCSTVRYKYTPVNLTFVRFCVCLHGSCITIHSHSYHTWVHEIIHVFSFYI